MKLREKIILLVAFLVGLYGLGDYFLFSGKNDLEQQDLKKAELDLETYVTAASAKLAVANIKAPGNMDYLISKVETDWFRDPFQVEFASGVVQEEEAPQTQGPELVYSGFMSVGKMVLAVVNGMEYRIGEVLNEVGYKISKITPSQVVLLTEANKEIVLYLEEN